MAGIRTALTNLVAIQEDVSITDPYGMEITEVFKHPPGAQIAPEPPFIVNTWSFPDQDLYIAQDVHRYTINMRVYIGEPDREDAGDIAAAFHEALLNAWRADPTLKNGGSAAVIEAAYRGGEPTLGILEMNGINYVGLDLYLDCQIARV